MKKLIFKVIGLTVMATMYFCQVACDPTLQTSYWIQEWQLANDTTQPIFYQFDDENIERLLPDERMKLYKKYLSYDSKKDFSIFFSDVKYQTLKIYLDPKGAPVKIWNRADAAISGKQFWNEKDWQEVDLNGAADAQDATWVFNITASDLSE